MEGVIAGSQVVAEEVKARVILERLERRISVDGREIGRRSLLETVDEKILDDETEVPSVVICDMVRWMRFSLVVSIE